MNSKAFQHPAGWAPPDGKRLLKSKASRDPKSIALLVNVLKMLAEDFYAEFGEPE